jgi:hypothetical protein
MALRTDADDLPGGVAVEDAPRPPKVTGLPPAWEGYGYDD